MNYKPRSRRKRKRSYKPKELANYFLNQLIDNGFVPVRDNEG